MLSEVQDSAEPYLAEEFAAADGAEMGEPAEATHYFFGEAGWQPIQVMEMEMPLELAQSGHACGYYAVVQSGEGFELGPAVPQSYVYEVPPPPPPVQPVAAPAEEPSSAMESSRSSPTGTASAWSEPPPSAHGHESKKEEHGSSVDERKENRAPGRPLVRGKRPEQGRQQGSPGPRGKARRGKDQNQQTYRSVELEKPPKPRKEKPKQNIFLFAPSKPTFTTVAAASSENWHRPGGDKVFAPEPPRSVDQPRFRRPTPDQGRSRRPKGSDASTGWAAPEGRSEDWATRPSLDGFDRADFKNAHARPPAEWTAEPGRPWTQSSDARPSTQSTADPGRPWTQSTDVGTHRAVSTADTISGGMGVIPPGLDSDSDEEEAARREIAEVEQEFELYPFAQPASGGGARSLRVLQGVRR
jgi:hypothetical protein